MEYGSVGYEFVARKSYPFLERGEARRIDEEFSYDIKTGEYIRIIEVDETNQLYTLLNLTLQSNHAWVKLTKDELDRLQRKGDTR